MIAPQSTQLSFSLREALRSSTLARHAAIDAAVMPAGVTWTRGRYGRFLRGSLAVVGAAEPAIAHYLPDFVTADARRAVRLRHDLRTLGDDAVVAPVALAIDDVACAFGAAYVIEGSMLGGQHVARALERDLGLEEGALTYLRPSGVTPGRRWSAFLAALEAFGVRATAAERRAAATAAQDTFDAFAEAFRREDLI